MLFLQLLLLLLLLLWVAIEIGGAVVRSVCYSLIQRV
jgi:hypothetical protein